MHRESWQFRNPCVLRRRFELAALLFVFTALSACSVPDDGGTVTSLGDCGDVTYQGKCEDGAFLWCKDEELYRWDCRAEGKECGPMGGSTGAYYCWEPCGEVTKAGTCNGNTLLWCHAGGLHQISCDTQAGGGTGAVCVWNSNGCDANCYGCGDLTAEGKCEGDLLKYCNYGVPWSVDCVEHGKHCGIDSATGHAQCLPVTPTETCEPGAFAAYCSDDGLYVSCRADGVVIYMDCPSEGLECIHDNPKGWTGCGGCENVPWWEEPCRWGSKPVCKSNIVFYEGCEEVCDAPR